MSTKPCSVITSLVGALPPDPFVTLPEIEALNASGVAVTSAVGLDSLVADWVTVPTGVPTGVPDCVTGCAVSVVVESEGELKGVFSKVLVA
jgi:hypothetical protein